ncbi:MAG: HDOD domain-containing protein [Pseudohongiellaceae bacterium]|nr:HDOD domain-containing protein [Pseudohongiellaceae bacterium]
MTNTVADGSNIQLERLVRVVLLQDGRGQVQVIMPQNNFLDLKKLNTEMGREFAPLSHADIVTMTHKRVLKELEIAPVFYNLPTVIDQKIANFDQYFYEVSDLDGSESIEFSMADLHAELNKADFRVNTIACSLKPSELPQGKLSSESDLDDIFASVSNFTTLRIKQRLEETLEIPPLPQTAQRIIKLRANPDASIDELADIVESDASLAAQVVSWASSPYYAAPGKIQSVKDAIVRVLGFDLVSNLAVGLALGNTLAIPKDKVEGLTPYWLQSVYCSTAVEAVLKQMPAKIRPSVGLACLAGLLHNFGDLVLAHIFPPHYSAICRAMEANPSISHVAIDLHLIGVTREQISAWLMQLWNMPPEVSTALRFQHQWEFTGENCEYANIVYMVLRLLRQKGIGNAPASEPVPAQLYERYDLDPSKVQEAIDKVVDAEENMRQIAENFKPK